MKRRTAIIIYTLILVAAVIFLALAMWLNKPLLVIPTIILFLASLLYRLAFFRCKYCNRSFAWFKSIEHIHHCPFCGNEWE